MSVWTIILDWMPQLYISKKCGVKRTDQRIAAVGAQGSTSTEHALWGGYFQLDLSDSLNKISLPLT